jgi:hypothetical protein
VRNQIRWRAGIAEITAGHEGDGNPAGMNISKGGRTA